MVMDREPDMRTTKIELVAVAARESVTVSVIAPGAVAVRTVVTPAKGARTYAPVPLMVHVYGACPPVAVNVCVWLTAMVREFGVSMSGSASADTQSNANKIRRDIEILKADVGRHGENVRAVGHRGENHRGARSRRGRTDHAVELV